MFSVFLLVADTQLRGCGNTPLLKRQSVGLDLATGRIRVSSINRCVHWVRSLREVVTLVNGSVETA